MKTKLKKDQEVDANTRYALRKISKQLLSVSVGLFFAGVLNEKEMPQAKAASLSNNDKISQVKADQATVAFGKIIPLDGDKKPIPNAPTPEYRRDPLDPDKAIATPVPKIKNYELAKDNQVKNFDAETKMVIPPANPQEDTEIIYLKQEVKPPVTDNKHPNTPAVKPQKKPSGQTNYYQGNINHYTSNYSRPVNNYVAPAFVNRNNYAAPNTSTTESDLNNDQAVDDASLVANPKNIVVVNDSVADSNKAQKQKKAKKRHPKHTARKTESKSKKIERIDSYKKTKQKPDKKKKGKEQHPKFLRDLPQVITNPEVKIPPKPRTATLSFIDLDENERLVFQMKTEGVPGTLIDFKNFERELLKRQKLGYELVSLVNKHEQEKLRIHQQYPFGLFGEDDVEFELSLKHKQVAASIHSLPDNLNPKLVKRTVSLVVRYQGAGTETPQDYVQSAVWTRTLTWDCVTKKLVDNGKFNTPWLSYPLTYDPVPSPHITGFVADSDEVPRMPVTSEDIIKTVNYQSAEEYWTNKEIEAEAELDNEETVQADDSQLTEPAEPEIPQDQELSDSEEEPVVENKENEPEESELEETPAVQNKSDEEQQQPSEPAQEQSDLQIRHFVDENGVELRPAQQIEADSAYPVIAGYYLASRDEADNSVTAVYKRLGQVVPVDLLGNLISEDKHYVFKNDSENAALALSDQSVPEISGWKPTTFEITPDNPGIDIPVVYQKD